MKTARFIFWEGMEGPAFLDLLEMLAGDEREIAALHSVVDGRWSVIGAEPWLTIEFSVEGVGRWIAHDNETPPVVPTGGAMLETFDAMIGGVKLDGWPTGVPGGWLGWVSYDIGRHLENIGRAGVDDMHWPLLRWTFFSRYFLFDHHDKKWTLITSDAEGLQRMKEQLAAVVPAREGLLVEGVITEALRREEYCRGVGRVIDYIGAGDVYQVNLAQRGTVETVEPPVRIFRRLCEASPASHAAYFRFGTRAIASASPELFIQRQGAHVRTRPIKGTRRRDHENAAVDAGLKSELWESAKDKAELAMIVDLLRNDLGRVCRYGSVQVVAARELEKHAAVWHTVATIEGELADADMGWGRIMAALCPGGSITGVPKIRAMQIIEELEPYRRGVYCGNIGWIGADGNGALNIAIRTVLMEKTSTAWRAWVWAGAGIVADSDPEAEFEETVVKGRAMYVALGVPIKFGELIAGRGA